MKKFHLILVALLAFVSIANAADVVTAGVKYEITETGEYDIDYKTAEAVPTGKSVVIFYYYNTTASHPFNIGTNWKGVKYNNEDGYVRVWCELAHNKYADGCENINLYPYAEAGEYWCYTICDDAEIMTVKSPLEEEGAGGTVEPIAPVSGSIVQKTEYTIPDTSGSSDEYYTTSEVIGAGNTFVVFYYKNATGNITGGSPVYFGPNGKNCLSKDQTLQDANGNSVCKLIANMDNAVDPSGHGVIEMYQPREDNATWCYVICSEAEAASLEVPSFGGGSTPEPKPIVPGQDLENAIVLTNGVAADFKSTNKTVYVKFVAENSGEVTMNLGSETTRARWMEDGVMAYGQLRQNMFKNGNQLSVEKGHTYYCLYEFASDVEGTVSYSLAASEEGAARGEAILIEVDGTQNLLGIAHIGSGSTAIYTNKTTWFKLEKDGTLTGKTVMTITLGGSNETEVALFRNDETDYIKSYAMGSGSGMLPVNSTVTFDIDLNENDYYIAITQDDVNGTAKFAFSVAQPGETFGSAIEAVAGANTAAAGTKYYKYTHAGDTKWMKITGSVIKSLYNEEQKEILNADDFSEGTEIADGTVVYFQATGNFSIDLTDVEAGRIPANPVIITGDNGATFILNGNSSDTRRYMQYTATDDGIFTYGTDNAKVMDTASSATVRDVTDEENPKTVTIVQKNDNNFGMFIYQWPVVKDHVYLIEQNLGNNFGTVDFYTMLEVAQEGESFNKAIAINLYDAIDLGRLATTPKYYKFTATQAGNYTVSVQMKGQVKSYDDMGNGSSISPSYSDGLVYHNGTFALAAGETLVFSCQPSEDIEHINVGINDNLIPNYYATITKADETAGLDYHQPEAIAENDEMTIDQNNVWYGPITVPAGETLYVQSVLNSATETSTVYFVVDSETNGLQWINKNADLSVSIDGNKQLFTLTPATEDRTIHLMACGLAASGTFKYSFTEPEDAPENPMTVDATPVATIKDGAITVKFTLPDVYTASEQDIENLNLTAVKIENLTNGQTFEITASTGDGAYSAGDEFSVTNAVPADFAAVGDEIKLVVESWGTTADYIINIASVTLQDGTTTGISAIGAATTINGAAFNLAGQRVAATAKGIIIVNGKKMLNK